MSRLRPILASDGTPTRFLGHFVWERRHDPNPQALGYEQRLRYPRLVNGLSVHVADIGLSRSSDLVPHWSRRLGYRRG